MTTDELNEILAKRIIDVSVEDLVKVILIKLQSPGTVQIIHMTTEELAKAFNCIEQRIHKYSALGMKKHRIKRDCWDYEACKKWLANEYPKVLRTKN